MTTTNSTAEIAETVLVTGASSGLGFSFAKHFALNGYSVVMVARDTDKLAIAVKKITLIASGAVTSIAIDLSKIDAARDLYESLKHSGTSIDILINNAGFATAGAFSETDYDKEQQEMVLNMVSLTLLTKLFLHDMLGRNRGRVLNIASLAAITPGPYMSVYYATKAYVLHFSEALHRELYGSNVTMSVFCPGPTQTNFAEVAGVSDARLFARKLPSADSAVKTAVTGLLAGKRTIFDTHRNSLMAFLLRFIPKKSALNIIARVNQM